jgi:predicted O-methyltransferase YrrM
MNDQLNLSQPTVVQLIQRDTATSGFAMASEPQTGSLLRTLAATKPAGAFLELGTGTGLCTAWILDGMDRRSALTTVDNDDTVLTIAKRHLGNDPRVTFQLSDGGRFLETLLGRTFDFIFADTWPGKYDHLDEALALLKPGGLYVIDDMLPQANWPVGHHLKAATLISLLEQRADLVLTKLSWASGLIVATKRETPRL